MRHLTLAFRTLVKTPFLTAVAIVSLALGIGANAAIYSLFDQLLLRPLPVSQPERLVNFSAPGPKPGSQSCGQAGDCETVFSYLMFRDLERLQTPFTGIAAHVAFGANLAFRGQTLSGEGTLVSGSYFPLLGLRPAAGRLIGPDDDRVPGASPVVVLSHAYWVARLGADPAIVGQSLTVNGQLLTIIGIAPRGFEGTTLGQQPEVFVPITLREQVVPGWKGFDNRRSYWAYLFARLAPGVSLDQARASINVPYRAILNDIEAPLQEGMSDQTMKRFRAREIALEDGRRGQSSLHREARVPMVLLLTITGVVLLIACANIANLLLARGASRSTEMAVRLSLGAGRGQLLAQLLTESSVLAFVGGAAGLFVAHGTLRLVTSLLPGDGARLIELALRPSVVLFAFLLSLAAGLLFGIFPALHSTRADLVTPLKAQAGQPSGARAAARFRVALVTVQIALSMALLISAGLFVKSLANVSRVDLGLKVDNLVTFGISPELNGYTPERSRVLFERLEEELAALPGVTSVAASMVPVLGGSNWGTDVKVEGFKSGPDVDDNARFNEVGPGYFHTLGIALLAGREFTRADAEGSAKVAIVNEAFTRKFNLGRDAVGKRMGFDDAKEMDHEIVGVVRDAKYSDVKQAIPPLFFAPYRQDDDIGAINFYIRASGDPGAVLRAVPGVAARLDPNLPVEELKTLPQQVRDNVALDRMVTTLAAAFALLATLLAAIGLYGVLAYTVAQRTREIGLRMALGADAADVRRMLLLQVGWMTLVGGVMGVAAALAIGRYAQSLLFEIRGHDPYVVCLAIVSLAAVALSAGFIPAFRASRIDPMRALRYE
jgi:predicted permease